MGEEKSALQTCVECIRVGYPHRSRMGKICKLTMNECIQDLEYKDGKFVRPINKKGDS